MEVRIPELQGSLALEPTDTNEKTEDYAGSVIFAAGILSCLDHSVCDNAAIWVGQDTLFDLASNNLLDLILQSQSDFSNLLRSFRGLNFIGVVRGKNCDAISDVTSSCGS